MHRYVSKSQREYVVYRGKDDPRKHRESAELWFYVPVNLFGTSEFFNDAFYTASEAEAALETHDVGFVRFHETVNKAFVELEALERRQTFRLVR